MDLELTIPHARGRQSAAIEVSFLRNLDETDVALLNAGYRIDSTTPAIKKIRASHHELARLLASGVIEVEASIITGYSQSRISILKNDPAFKNLMSFYMSKEQEIAVEVSKRLRNVGLAALEELQERLDDKPEEFTREELRKLAESTFDRSGHGPKATVAHEYSVDPNTLAALKAEVQKKEENNVVEVSEYTESSISGEDGRATELREEGEAQLGSEERLGLPAPSGQMAPSNNGGSGS